MNCYHHLSVKEREEISRGLACGVSFRRIAPRLGRAVSTISREVARNASSHQHVYRAHRAQTLAASRARQPRRARKLASTPRLWRWVVLRLGRRWSPHQISHRLKRDYPGDVQMRVSHSTIYKTLHRTRRGPLRRRLVGALRRGFRKKRRDQGHPDYRGKIPGMKSIHERPKVIEERDEAGHWEGDLLMGRGNAVCVGTLVERKTRYTKLVRLEGTTAAMAKTRFEWALRQVPRQLRRTLTYDRGKEMAKHYELSRSLRMEIYFADAHHPWQRGTNENTNGLLRQYLPKGIGMEEITQSRLEDIARALNQRPRQCLGWATPQEAFTEARKRCT